MRTCRAMLLLTLLAAGCQSSGPAADLAAIYNRAARHHGPEQSPVIVIPGILGSRLVERHSDQVVWGAFSGGYADPRTPAGARLVALPLSAGEAPDDDAHVDPDGVLESVQLSLLGLPVELKAYVDILRTLGAGGFRDELLGASGAVDYGTDHYTCFQFAYDWRRDNAWNAARLHAFILEKRRAVQARIERDYGIRDHDVRFNIVAHSMGGLVLRYFLRYGDQPLTLDGPLPELNWAGARYVNRAILVGTPNAGSAEAIKQLVEGRPIGPITRYAPAILGTMPAIYQLMPRTRHAPLVDARDHRPLDLYDPALWRDRGWGLADPREATVLRWLLPDAADDDARRQIALAALERHLRRAERFHAALDVAAHPPAGLSLDLFLGDAVATRAALAVEPSSAALRDRDWGPGDGTVLRSSALLDERVGGQWQPRLRSPIAWRQVVALFSDHLGLTRDPAFSDNVLFNLLEAP